MNHDSIEIIVDKDIRLKIVGIEDAESIFNTINRERKYLEEWLPFVEDTRDISYTKAFIEHSTAAISSNYTFTISYHNHFAGVIGFKDTDFNNKKTEIGYWLSESFQHKGIITRSCKALINYAFDKMDMNRIQIKAAEENQKSRNVAERLGFTCEGIERDGELHSRGFVDLVIYSLLKAER
jgi:ribosomal-protein-serine acetyltransferase